MYDEKDEWRDEASCKGDPAQKWFPDERYPVHTIPFREELQELRSICQSCPVQRQCLEDALRSPTSIDHGIYAGTTPQQRRKIIKESLDVEDEED